MTSPYKVFQTLEKINENVIPYARARVTAAILYRNNIISIGYNQGKSHTFQARYSHHPMAHFLHAENHAILMALKKLDRDELAKASLFVCRLKHNNAERHPSKETLKWGLAKPCLGCQKAIEDYNIKKVFYTISNDNSLFEYGTMIL